MEPGEPYKCSGCQELGFGSSYRCESNKCSYVLHEACAHAVLDKSPVRHPFFKEDKFSFLEKPLGWPRHCQACRKEVHGFVYHRADNGRPDDTGLDLHPCCLELKDSISYKDRNVSRTLQLRPTIPKKCLKCKSMKVKDDFKVRGWAYESSDEKYCFHVSCFKELIIDKWKEGYFSEKRMSMLKYDPKTQPPLTDKKIVKDGGSSKGSEVIKTLGKLASVIIPLIFTAIFGNPISIVSIVLAVVESLPAIIKLVTI